jgi:uncharacterized membrane protein YcaP (DUF421 family)
MDFIKISVLSLTSLIVLFILTKLMGNKEMSQLSMFDYIIGITIGSIAAEMSTALEDEFWQPLLAMFIYALVSIIISFISSKSLKFRRIVTGTTLVLLDNGKLYYKNFKKAKLDLDEFLMLCRVNGYFNISDIQTALLESNGKISFLPKAESRPTITSDFDLKPSQERITVNVILDQKILYENLEYTGNDYVWLQNQLTKQGVKDIKDVFLATCDSKNKLSIYTKEFFSNSHDFYN